MAKKKKKKWIAGAVSKKGAFLTWVKKRGYKSVTAKAIAEGLRSKDPTTRRRASLARTLAKMRKKRKK